MKKFVYSLIGLSVLLALLILALPLAAQTATKDMPYCADLSGQTTPIVRYEIPWGTVSSGGVYCRFLVQNGNFLVNSAQIGNGDVLSYGVSQAVDVFAILNNGSNVTVFNNPIKICLQGSGSMFFLDATQSPRPLVQLTTTSDGGYTCGSVQTAGTVLLTNSGPAAPPPAASTLPGTPGTPAATPSGTVTAPASTQLTNCRVTVSKIVRLRAEPNTTSTIITRLAYNTSWTVTERVPGWYRIIYENRQGWVSDQFVRPSGSCGS